ncbi:uncharacterized protein LOC105762517 [Gossypium raimondii]|uniref:uncharacterized protein LOC105762517 n=1 Tax=Gossypium raimondii TaxID=29730 RepID=UPI00063A9F59|nr:uncharacterized protein LOC105762517 [Gossypium raimondii]
MDCGIRLMDGARSTLMVQVWSTLEAELWGALEGLRPAWETGLARVILVNNVAVVQMVNGEDRKLHHELVVRVKNMHRRTWEVKVQHVYREGNAVAVHMAALARGYGMDLQIYRSPPVELMKLVTE